MIELERVLTIPHEKSYFFSGYSLNWIELLFILFEWGVSNAKSPIVWVFNAISWLFLKNIRFSKRRCSPDRTQSSKAYLFTFRTTKSSISRTVICERFY